MTHDEMTIRIYDIQFINFELTTFCINLYRYAIEAHVNTIFFYKIRMYRKL